MLISGFWLENLDDVFQTLVFPSVANGFLSYFFLWFRKALENLAYLLFLTGATPPPPPPVTLTYTISA